MSAALSRFLTVREQILLGGFAVAICIGAGALYYAQATPTTNNPVSADTPIEKSLPEVPRPRAQATEKPLNTDGYVPTASAPAAASEIGVAIRGAVRRPGLYYFQSGDRVDNLITAAGGFTESADDSDINISARLIDGSTLIVPRQILPQTDGTVLRNRMPTRAPPPNPPSYTISGWRDSVAPGTPSNTASGFAGGKINLNTATKAELESLPGVGPAYATRIIEFRKRQRFERIEDLMFISGIAEKRFAALKDLVTVN